MPTATMKGVGPSMPPTKTTTSKGRGKKKGGRNGSTSGPAPSAMGASPGVTGYPASATMGGSAPGTPVRYPSPFQPSDPAMFNAGQAGPGGPGGGAGPGGPGAPGGVNPMGGPPTQTPGGPVVGPTGGGPSVGAPPGVPGGPGGVGASYPQSSQPPTSWYQGGQQPMTAAGPQQTPLYSNTPYPRMPYMAHGTAPSKCLAYVVLVFALTSSTPNQIIKI